MTLLDGKALAKEIRAELKKQVQASSIVPGLAAVRVGNDEASKVYVGHKVKACDEVGMYSRVIELPEETSQGQLIETVQELNVDDKIHGILVQLPLPKQISSDQILATIHSEKDVDGFHVENLGRLFAGQSGFIPCTPLGIIRLLKHYNVPIQGAHAVVVGRSNIVGKPVAHLLLGENATVTICHSKTKDLKDVCLSADILIAAIGRPEFISGDWIKKGAAVVDVGINRKEDRKLVGDVAFKPASERAKWISPVPGGVGPLTIAMLLENTYQAAQKKVSSS